MANEFQGLKGGVDLSDITSDLRIRWEETARIVLRVTPKVDSPCCDGRRVSIRRTCAIYVDCDCGRLSGGDLRLGKGETGCGVILHEFAWSLVVVLVEQPIIVLERRHADVNLIEMLGSEYVVVEIEFSFVPENW